MMQLNIIFPNGLRIEFADEDMKKFQESSVTLPMMSYNNVTLPFHAGDGNQEAKAEQIEKKAKKHTKVPLTNDQKVKILEMHAAGVSNQDITSMLGIKDARQTHGVIMSHDGFKKPIAVEAHNSPVVDGRPQEIQSPKKEPDPAKEVKLAPARPNCQDRLNEADRMILALKKTGISSLDIAASIGRSLGGAWTPAFVEQRIRELEAA